MDVFKSHKPHGAIFDSGTSAFAEPAAPYAKFSSSVKCAVDFYGAVGLIHYHDVRMFAKTREEAPDVYKKASPVTDARKDAPPILILHGTADDAVNVSQSETLAAALQGVGAPHELIIIPGAPHTFHLENVPGHDLRPLVFGFFDKNLKVRN